MKKACIQVHNLNKRYQKAERDSLSGISLEVLLGEKFGILGPNGAGKTTFISILCGILEASSGSVDYYNSNAEPSNLKAIKSSIGFVPQEYAFYETLSPVQNLEYFGALYNLSREQIKTNTNRVLRILGLSEVGDKKIHTFSGGMKRRVNLAIGIIHQPAILFLDEPTVGIDVQSKVAILRFLDQINSEGCTIIYTSHHLAEAQAFCDRIALIDLGKLIAIGEIQKLLEKHQTSDLQELFIKFTGEAYRD